MFITIATVTLIALLLYGTSLISHVFTLNYTRSGEAITTNVTISADGEINLTHAWVSAPTDVQLALAFEFADAKSIFIKSTKAATLETNATDATGGNTITLVADKPFVWYEGCGLANPFTQNVTTAYLTSAIATGQIDIRILFDGTP